MHVLCASSLPSADDSYTGLQRMRRTFFGGDQVHSLEPAVYDGYVTVSFQGVEKRTVACKSSSGNPHWDQVSEPCACLSPAPFHARDVHPLAAVG